MRNITCFFFSFFSEGMFSFLNSFYKSASDCHSKFCSWLQSSNMQTSGFSGCDVQSLKPVIDGSAKGLFLDMQKLMISYRAILTRMTEGNPHKLVF